MKWLIVEDALRDRKGHWLEYVSTFVRELRALGDEVVVLCDRNAQGFVVEQTGARPGLPESIWHRMGDGAGALKRYLRVPGHAIATFFAIRRVFSEFNHGGHGGHRGGVGKQTGKEVKRGRSADAHGDAQGTCAGAAFSNPSTSELARDSENTAPTRSASDPALAAGPPIADERALIADESKLVSSSTKGKAHDAGRWSLGSGEAPDWIFVPTVLVHHLLGWWLILKARRVPGNSRVLLFFPNLPIRLDDEARPHWTAGPTTKLMVWLFAQLRADVGSGKVVLGVETHAMQRALEGLIRMPVVYLPHPVPAQGETSPAKEVSTFTGQGVEGRESRASLPVTSNPLTATSAKPIVFGCYGAARWEKGSDIFQEAIQLILKNEVASGGCRVASVRNQCTAGLSEPVTKYSSPATAVGRPLHFAIQWVEDFRDDSGNLISIDPGFCERSQVEVIGRYFKGDEYERRLALTDVMVLPYRSPYRLRVSRVVIEAMLKGMPVVATRGTTLFEQAKEYGVVVGCMEGDAESLAEAMLEVAAQFKMLRESASKKAKLAAESFSVDCFKKTLLHKYGTL